MREEASYLKSRDVLLPLALNKEGMDLHLQESSFLRSREVLGALLVYMPKLFDAYEDKEQQKEQAERDKEIEKECVALLLGEGIERSLSVLDAYLTNMTQAEKNVKKEELRTCFKTLVNDHREGRRRIEP